MTRIKCLKCGDIIESKGHRHNFVSCKCGLCSVDGGDSYSKISGDLFLVWDEKFNEFRLLNNELVLVGIDPGKTGYISILDDKGLYYYDLSKVSILDIYCLLKRYEHWGRKICGIEQATAYKGQGTKSINTYLVNYGKLLGVLEILGFNIIFVTPRKWQKFLGVKSDIKIDKLLDKQTKNMLRYNKRKEIKNMSIQKAKDIWKIDINDHNLADSLLILTYIIEEGIKKWKG